MKDRKNRGSGKVPKGCPSDRPSLQGGLCYKPCDDPSFPIAIGPVCWQSCKASKNYQIGCGAGCADSKKTCGNKITDQALSVIGAILGAVTEGAGAEMMSGITVIKTAAQVADKLATAIDKGTLIIQNGANVVSSFVEKYNADSDLDKAASNAAGIPTGLNDDEVDQSKFADATQAAMEEAMTAVADLMVCMGDPTGVCAIIQAFADPICSAKNLKPTWL